MTYRRRILLRSTTADEVVGDLEDDFHRFRVTLSHEHGRVRRVGAEALRFPWTTCPDAAAPLRALEGTALTARVTHAADVTSPRANCTHMFDLAALAMTHALRDDERRGYDAALTPLEGSEQIATLERDGASVLRWTIRWGDDGARCVDPEPFASARWRGGFMRWADATLDPELAEAAVVLRRVADIGLGKGMALDRYERASDLEYPMIGVCYTMQAERIEVAFRNRDTIRDFTERPDALLDDVGP